MFFLILGLVEEVTISHAGRFKKRIVAVCAAGLVAGRIISFCAPDSRAALSRLPEIETVPVLQGLVGYRKPSHFSARFLTVSQNPATKRIAFTIPEGQLKVGNLSCGRSVPPSRQ